MIVQLEVAKNIYKDLLKNGIDVLIDDTDENLSSKIKNYLLGIPFQIIIVKILMHKKLNLKKLIKILILFHFKKYLK